MDTKPTYWTEMELSLLKELWSSNPTYTAPQIQEVFNNLVGTERARSLDSVDNKLKILRRESVRVNNQVYRLI